MHPHDQYITQNYTSETQRRRRARFKTAVDVVHHGSWIAIFSFWGVLARLGLTALNDYPGVVVPPLTWSQFVGCAVMGFLVRDASLFPKKSGSVKYDALYVGLTTGFCGSLTTFSSWMLAVYEDLANIAAYDRPTGYNVISILAQLGVQFAAALVGFKLGDHLARGYATLPRHWCIRRPIPRPAPGTTSEMVATLLAIMLALGSTAGAVLVAALKPEWRPIAGYAIVFAPVGALARWYLARTFNDRLSSLPVGTLSANVGGTFLEGIFYLGQYYIGSRTGCGVLQGLQDGLSGTLTTVSTLILELITLELRHAYRYGFLSVALSLSFLVLIDGIDFWTHGSSHGGHGRCRTI